MLEGLAVWSLLIYLLRLVGMPWNKATKSFSVVGGGAWLVFVWYGLITYTPMDMSGGSLVQAPHVQLRPNWVRSRGYIEHLHVSPNQAVEKGQLIYELNSDEEEINLDKALATLERDQIKLTVSKGDVLIAKEALASAKQDIEIAQNELDVAKEDLRWKLATLERYQEQNRVVSHSVTESQLDEQRTAVQVARSREISARSQLDKAHLAVKKSELDLEKAHLTVDQNAATVANSEAQVEREEWRLSQTKVYAPQDGFLTNFIAREGQFMSRAPRINMYTNEKYVLMRVNHQAISRIKVGQAAEFASAVYPGHVFQAEVEGIVRATGEAQGNLLGLDDSVRVTTGKNAHNKHHFVRLKIHEPEGYDIPVGAVGLAWVSAEKPVSFLGFLDVIRGIIIRMKSQIYFVYSL